MERSSSLARSSRRRLYKWLTTSRVALLVAASAVSPKGKAGSQKDYGPGQSTTELMMIYIRKYYSPKHRLAIGRCSRDVASSSPVALTRATIVGASSHYADQALRVALLLAMK